MIIRRTNVQKNFLERCCTKMDKKKYQQYIDEKKELIYMGDSTGSMFYAFLLFIVIYILGMAVYQVVQLIKKWRENRKDRLYREEK